METFKEILQSIILECNHQSGQKSVTKPSRYYISSVQAFNMIEVANIK